jgi:hypothetical protein
MSQRQRDEFVARIRDLAKRLMELADDPAQAPEARRSLASAAADLRSEADRIERDDTFLE